MNRFMHCWCSLTARMRSFDSENEKKFTKRKKSPLKQNFQRGFEYRLNVILMVLKHELNRQSSSLQLAYLPEKRASQAECRKYRQKR